MNRVWQWAGAAVVALVIMLAPHTVAAILLLGVLLPVSGWLAWHSLTGGEEAVDDRADLVEHEPRRLPDVAEKVRHAQRNLPPAPRLPPLPRRAEPLPGEVPGTIQGWLRSPKRKV